MTAGYSGTPLAKKLGIKDGHRVAVMNEPKEFRRLLGGASSDVSFQDHPDDSPDLVIAFYTERAALTAALPALADAVFPDRAIWLAWPKRSSGVETDLTGNVVREEVLVTKLVDIKVAAISEIWSGLKVVWRKEQR